jgi:NitT/TauT family transport system substrate-binding protein
MSFALRVTGFFLLAGLWAGCGREQRPAARPAGGEPAPKRKVVLQTDWFPQAEHGGYYQALARGFYAEAGLEVAILPGGPGAGIKLKVAKGEADFGMNRSHDVILAASQGLPIMIVAATLQHDPLALMVHDASPVRTLRDLNGRVVVGNVGLAYFPFLERKLGLKFEKRQSTYGMGEFLANPDLIQQCLVTNEPFFARQHGKPVRVLALRDAGYDAYDALFCRRELIREAPDVVRAFVWASIRGWRDYMDGNPAPGNAEILKRNGQMTAAQLEFSRSEMIIRSLVHGDPERDEDIGQISLGRIGQEIDVLTTLRILEAPMAVSQVATKEFLPPPGSGRASGGAGKGGR